MGGGRWRAGEPDMLEMGVLLGRARRKVRREVQRQLESRGGTALGWALLKHLSVLGSATQQEIAAATGQHPAGISRQLEEMEGARLVRRGRDREDRRCLRVRLTARGRRILADWTPAAASGIARALASLRPDELRLLRGLLERLVELEPVGVAGVAASRSAGRT